MQTFCIVVVGGPFSEGGPGGGSGDDGFWVAVGCVATATAAALWL